MTTNYETTVKDLNEKHGADLCIMVDQGPWTWGRKVYVVTCGTANIRVPEAHLGALLKALRRCKSKFGMEYAVAVH